MREKINNLSFRPGQTQTGLYSQRSRLEAGNFGFRKKRNCTICIAKTKALISFAVTMKLNCVFVFAYAGCWFSHEVAQIVYTYCMRECDHKKFYPRYSLLRLTMLTVDRQSLPKLTHAIYRDFFFQL